MDQDMLIPEPMPEEKELPKEEEKPKVEEPKPEVHEEKKEEPKPEVHEEKKAPEFDPNHITPEQREQYATLFRKADTNNRGIVNGAEGREFFSKSRAPFKDLGKIWSLADLDGDNKLNKREFAIAMDMVFTALRKFSIPAFLPDSLKEDAMLIEV